MSLRLHHRRSSASREKLHMQLGGAGGERLRALSLHPGHLLAPPPPTRARSHSCGGSALLAHGLGQLEREEELAFRRYTRTMYVLLGGLAALATGLFAYGLARLDAT